MAQGMGGHSTSNVMHHLKGVSFPATRDDLSKLAKKNHADKEILEVIGNMPDEEYASVAEVLKGVGQGEHKDAE